MASDDPTASALERISRDECMELVKSLSIGRVAVAVPDQAPLVVPVNYVLDGEVVVFRSDLGTKLSAVHHQPISFQVDFVDPFHRTGWSVLIQGDAYEATAWEVGHLDIRPWAGGDKQHWVRLVPKVVTGRRIALPEVEPLDARGYL